MVDQRDTHIYSASQNPKEISSIILQTTILGQLTLEKQNDPTHQTKNVSKTSTKYIQLFAREQDLEEANLPVYRAK